MFLPITAILAAKASSKLIKSLNLGKASALPGRVALAIYPKILEYYQEQLLGSELQFFITGTNGKTTSTGLLKQIVIEHLKLSKQSPELICNDYGANLYYGICTELINSSSILGRIKSANYALELDEAAFVSVAKVLQPNSITVTNLFRDQLDRFGEIDSTQKLIVKGIEELLAHRSINIILNADDSKVSDIKNLLQCKDNRHPAKQSFASDAALKKVATARSACCPSSNNLDFSRKSNTCTPEFYFYRVKHHGKQIENLDAGTKHSIVADEDCFIVEVLEEQINYSQIKLKKGHESIELKLNLPGLYNIYNACSAAATAYSKGISLAAIKLGLENYQCNFGRSETKSIDGKNYQVFLIKNPTGCTEVLKHLNQDTHARYLIAINDNYADGRDVSWLWDARFDYINTGNKIIYCSGHRAEDMALRLKYAGINPEHIIIEKNVHHALKIAASETLKEENLYVLPTYTALLELNKYG